MKNYFVAGALAALLSAGCASMNESVTKDAVGQSDPPQLTFKDGKRHEVMVGSRIARETRENSESVKTVGPRAYQESKIQRSGSGLDGGG